MKLFQNPLTYTALAILLLAAFFRFYGLNWDQNQHLHPDERFLTMVTDGIEWPATFHEFLSADTSPLNPHNKGFSFFVYGTFPVFFTKWIAEGLGMGDYTNITLVGRALSGLFDLGTVVLVFLISKNIISNNKFLISKQIPNSKTQLGQLEIRLIRNFPLLAMFFYACMVLPIQLSHFYAVEMFLTFFMTVSFFLLIIIMRTARILYFPLLGISLGLSIASKISAVYIIPIIAIGLLLSWFRIKSHKNFLIGGILMGITLYMTVRLAQPYLFNSTQLVTFELNPKVLMNWKELTSFMNPESGFPPSVQWFNRIPLLFALRSLIFLGMGIPLAALFIGTTGFTIAQQASSIYNSARKRIIRIPNTALVIRFLMLVWIVGLFVYQGTQVAPTIRYFHPIYPFIAIMTAWGIHTLQATYSKVKIVRTAIVLLVFLSFAWPISFMAIYSRPHSRVAASEWIYSHIPAGSKIGVEHWDDALPLSLSRMKYNEKYQFIELPLYHPDTPDKWDKMSESLNQTEYIILSSNRLFASIPRAEKLFPVSKMYYQALFDGTLGFEKIAEVTSFPIIPFPIPSASCLYLFPTQEEVIGLVNEKSGFLRWDRCNIYDASIYNGIVFRDEAAEETFTVYDHPKVLIFKKTKPLPKLGNILPIE